IQFYITYTIALVAFWILEISTIVFIIYSFEYFLGGQMFPVDIMPTGIQAAMKWLPFYYELFCPIAIFMERLRGAEMMEALAIQAGWVLFMWAVAHFMWKRGLGHYQAGGGWRREESVERLTSNAQYRIRRSALLSDWRSRSLPLFVGC